jgi:hypothetical protein
MLFVSQIEGPTSEEDFAHECAEIVLPGLSDRKITAAAWTTAERNGFYLHGCVEGDPPVMCPTLSDRLAGQRKRWCCTGCAT